MLNCSEGQISPYYNTFVNVYNTHVPYSRPRGYCDRLEGTTKRTLYLFLSFRGDSHALRWHFLLAESESAVHQSSFLRPDKRARTLSLLPLLNPSIANDRLRTRLSKATLSGNNKALWARRRRRRWRRYGDDVGVRTYLSPFYFKWKFVRKRVNTLE